MDVKELRFLPKALHFSPAESFVSFAAERKINLRRLKNRSPEIEKSFGAEKNNALQRLSYLLQGVIYYAVSQLFIHLKSKYSPRLGFVNPQIRN